MFNKETEYAIRGLIYIQFQNDLNLIPNINEIALNIDAPQHFMAKILQKMVRQNFINSQKGKGGGFYFDKTKPELPLIEIILLIEGDKKVNGCAYGLNKCDNNNPCPLHNQYVPIREAINKLFSEETIQSMAAKSHIDFKAPFV
ncbi:MAG: Rrf2 family transcriptional regulator [Flavobacteriaceae bacterium]|nr:Rrf2 family transcriptional regulator [Flavobacteriaceae bacterium]